MNVRLLLIATIPPPPPQEVDPQWLFVNSLFPARVMLALIITSAVPKLSLKEQLTSSAYCVDCINKPYLLLLQCVKARECIPKSTIFVKLKPTDPLQMTFTIIPKEDSPRMINLATLRTVIFLLRMWSPGKKIIVVLEAKYSSASFAYVESVVQLVELRGQDEHEVAVGVTQYNLSAEQ